MGKITIDLFEEGKIRALLLKLNKEQKKVNKPEFTIEEFVSMLLATPEFIEMIDLLSNVMLMSEDEKKQLKEDYNQSKSQ